MSGQRKLSSELLKTELQFSASRSGGPGGQNVNKVNSKITLKLDVHNSQLISEEEKTVLLQKLNTRQRQNLKSVWNILYYETGFTWLAV